MGRGLAPLEPFARHIPGVGHPGEAFTVRPPHPPHPSPGWKLGNPRIWESGTLELKQQSNAPIGSTLADFILRKNIKLQGDDVTVVAATRDEDNYTVKLVQSEDPQAGSLTLIFSIAPMQLKEWVVVDAQGLTTRVKLSDVETGIPLDRDLFYYIDPEHGNIQLNE